MKFEKYVDFKKLPDSMCLDSGTSICRLEDGNDTLSIEVRGYVKVEYDGYYYRHYSDMPVTLQKMFAEGTAYNNPEVTIHEGNWYEVFYNQDKQYDVAEIDGEDVSDLEGYCRGCMELFRSVEGGIL